MDTTLSARTLAPIRETVTARWDRLGRPASRRLIADARALADEPTYERNIENYLGTIRIPVGLAGPVRIRGIHANGDFSVPLATTEATLVASYHRGMRTIDDAGGCNAAVLAERVERTPAFVVTDLPAAVRLAAWIREMVPLLATAAEETSRFARCLAIEPIVEGNQVFLSCVFQTGEAAGQNMVTIATAEVCAYICANAPVSIARHVVEANLSGDKKASHRALAGTRGKRVSADVVIDREILARRLHVTPEALAAYWQLGAVGAAMSGAVGIQGHFANGLAALALATGQDVACVAESATGITRFAVTEAGHCYAAVTLPNLMIGSVGGGTHLPAQRAALELIGEGHPLGANALAEVAAALVLAGELSISAAICAQEFTAAHKRFARGVAAS